MVREFMDSMAQGKSMVKQMIMGQGKTTVVGPLLALMLGDNKSLVCQVRRTFDSQGGFVSACNVFPSPNQPVCCPPGCSAGASGVLAQRNEEHVLFDHAQAYLHPALRSRLEDGQDAL
jgi:hypothetical protein